MPAMTTGRCGSVSAASGSSSLIRAPPQADKARRLRAIASGPAAAALAEADFQRDDAAAVLASSGHQVREPSLFLCEGLLVYLDLATIRRLLAGPATRAAPGSTLAASLAVHPAGLDSVRVTAAANARRRAGDTEPWRTILPADAQLALVRDAGWHAEHVVDATDLEPAAVPGRDLLVTARRS